jgi:hypothetical protein
MGFLDRLLGRDRKRDTQPYDASTSPPTSTPDPGGIDVGGSTSQDAGGFDVGGETSADSGGGGGDSGGGGGDSGGGGGDSGGGGGGD